MLLALTEIFYTACMGEDHKQNSLSALVVLKVAEMEVLAQVLNLNRPDFCFTYKSC